MNAQNRKDLQKAYDLIEEAKNIVAEIKDYGNGINKSSLQNYKKLQTF